MLLLTARNASGLSRRRHSSPQTYYYVSISSVSTVSLSKDFVVLQKYVLRFLKDTLTGLKHPQTVPVLYVHSVKMATVVGAINCFIPSGYVQPAWRISLGSKFTSLDLETFDLDLQDLWPWTPMALKISGLGLSNAVLEHISGLHSNGAWHPLPFRHLKDSWHGQIFCDRWSCHTGNKWLDRSRSKFLPRMVYSHSKNHTQERLTLDEKLSSAFVVVIHCYGRPME